MCPNCCNQSANLSQVGTGRYAPNQPQEVWYGDVKYQPVGEGERDG
jgi:hypothetical protein